MSDNILDLSSMGANYERNNVKQKIIKIGDNTVHAPYAVFDICENGKIHFWGFDRNLSSYTPIPNAPQWVTLTTTDKRKVQCQFVATHVNKHKRPFMLLECRAGSNDPVSSSAVAIELCGSNIDRSSLDWFTPIPAPAPLGEAKVKKDDVRKALNDAYHSPVFDVGKFLELATDNIMALLDKEAGDAENPR